MDVKCVTLAVSSTCFACSMPFKAATQPAHACQRRHPSSVLNMFRLLYLFLFPPFTGAAAPRRSSHRYRFNVGSNFLPRSIPVRGFPTAGESVQKSAGAKWIRRPTELPPP
eukprot:CAMPEP_0172024726 /NCGR_PEP_ID=MMETSP1041-20130122/15506_1 /TAXON_ID=464988 /ORGANISM="Hemiselmis andersenii, Strain CCMP439" /LENGTH=110 /DNA_ID=CAMNT_0012680351 /DNA_START=117 /DNA_END=445 /DNA_ORIENTATION=+